MCNRERLVRLIDEGVYGRIIGPLGAYYTIIRYTLGGIDYEVFVENDDFEILEGDEIDYDE